MAKKQQEISVDIASLKITILAIGFSFILSAIPTILEWIKIPGIKNLFSNSLSIIYLVLGGWLFFVAWKIGKNR